MSIIGEEISGYVSNQIQRRQSVQGSGVNSLRSGEQLAYLNSKTAWVKFASAVYVEEDKLKDIGLNNKNLSGMELAKKHILFGGTSELAGPKNNQWVKPKPSNTNLSGYDHSKDWGIVPMPGIESMDIKTLSRGSLEKATIKIKAYSKEQFDIIDILYLRLGYSVLLEWGNSNYITNSGEFANVRGTLIEDNTKFFSDSFEKGGSYRNILGPIGGYRNKYDGNYDGLFGKISNFNWSFNPDGSYDITITVISLGDVIESLKTNISSNYKFTEFAAGAISTIKTNEKDLEEKPATTLLNDAPTSDDISAMLWTWKYVNRKEIINNTAGPNNIVTIKINSQNTGGLLNYTGFKLKKDTTTLETDQYTFYAVYSKSLTNNDLIVGGKNLSDIDENDKHILFSRDDLESPGEALRIASLVSSTFSQPFVFGDDDLKKTLTGGQDYIDLPPKFTEAGFGAKNIREEYKTTQTSFLTGEEIPISKSRVIKGPGFKIGVEKSKTIKTKNPLKYITKSEPCFLLRTKTPQYYLKFGALLEFMQRAIIPHTKTGKGSQALFKIDSSDNRKMYHLPNQISLDPRVCLVRNDRFQKRKNSFARVFPQLSPFRLADKNPKKKDSNIAFISNIYLNFNFITDSLESNKDEKGDVGLFGFLSSICDGLNKALGGVNNLEPVVDKVTNVLSIQDSTPIPGYNIPPNEPAEIQIYGYNNDQSNFVRNINLKTSITPEYATMITVGATAGGYVKGTDATAFSNWNRGLIDRFNGELENNIGSETKDEARKNYAQKFLRQLSLCYGFNGIKLESEGKEFKLVEDSINNNVSIVTEFYKYLQNSKRAGNSMGFIPFKLSLTLDGISGIKIYNVLHIDGRFLPSNYDKTLNLIVTGITHKLSNNDWETDIELTVMPKPVAVGDLGSLDFDAIGDDIDNYLASDTGGGSGGEGVFDFAGGGDVGTVPTSIGSGDRVRIDADLTTKWKTSNKQGEARGAYLYLQLITGDPKTGNKNFYTIPGAKNPSGKKVYITSGFGIRNMNKKGNGGNDKHEGIDIASGGGLPLTCPFAKGKITKYSKSWGICVIEELDPTTDIPTGRVVRFIHNQTLIRKRGDIVKFNDKVGQEGKAGEGGGDVYATHSHYEVYVKGEKGKTTIDGKKAIPHTTQGTRIGLCVAPTLEEIKCAHGISTTPLPLPIITTEGGIKNYQTIGPPPVNMDFLNTSIFDQLQDQTNSNTSTSSSAKGVILMTGLTHRANDKTHQQQIDLFKAGYNGTVFGYTYKPAGLAKLKEAMTKNPDFAVVLFSKACEHSKTIANLIKTKSNLYMVEPYVVGYSGVTYKGVRAAVNESKVPAINVQTGGGNPGNRGYGVLLKHGGDPYLGIPSKSPEAGSNELDKHFKALTFMGSKIK